LAQVEQVVLQVQMEALVQVAQAIQTVPLELALESVHHLEQAVAEVQEAL
jgi:hypothetical protein